MRLVEKAQGIAAVTVVDFSGKLSLSWDRFVRLKAAGDALTAADVRSVLDVGGYDGALAFFLPKGVDIDVIDPATTGGSAIAIACADRAYEAVAAIDLLEHIHPDAREEALSVIARVAGRCVVLNYPSRESLPAQKLALKLTENSLIREHVEWELPDSEWVLSVLAHHGFSGTIRRHANIGIWLSQYVTLNLVPQASAELNHYLIEHHADESFDAALYHLLTCERTMPLRTQ